MVSMISVADFLYLILKAPIGVYVVLFTFSLVVLRHRKAKKLPNNGIHFLSMIILFLVTTLTTIMHSIEVAYSVSKLDSSSESGQPFGSDSDKETRHPSAELWRALMCVLCCPEK